jgi:hypothetical protein
MNDLSSASPTDNNAQKIRLEYRSEDDYAQRTEQVFRYLFEMVENNMQASGLQIPITNDNKYKKEATE